jgi:CRP-like cAMP-binding protein
MAMIDGEDPVALGAGERDSRSAETDDAVSSVAYVLGLLTDEDVDWLVSHGEHRRFDTGELAVREGAPTPSLMLVLEGAMLARS